jgi:predicted transcriptional regulator
MNAVQLPPERWRIVEFVRVNPDKSAKDIATAVGMDTDALSHDLRYLSNSSILISSTTKPKIWRVM